MLVDKTMEGHKFYVDAIGTLGNYDSRYLKVSYLDEGGEVLGTSQSVNIQYAWSTNNYHLTYGLNGIIPEGTKKLKFFGYGTGQYAGTKYVGVANIQIK